MFAFQSVGGIQQDGEHSDQLHQGRRGSRVQKGGGSYIQKGGGGFVEEFQERIQIVAGPWANQQAKKKNADSRGGGGGGVRSPPQKTCIRARYMRIWATLESPRPLWEFLKVF